MSGLFLKSAQDAEILVQGMFFHCCSLNTSAASRYLSFGFIQRAHIIHLHVNHAGGEFVYAFDRTCCTGARKGNVFFCYEITDCIDQVHRTGMETAETCLFFLLAGRRIRLHFNFIHSYSINIRATNGRRVAPSMLLVFPNESNRLRNIFPSDKVRSIPHTFVPH